VSANLGASKSGALRVGNPRHRHAPGACRPAAPQRHGRSARGCARNRRRKIDGITCEQFLALNPDDQNRIAYWVDGYAQAKTEAMVGTVALDKFGQPIGELVDACKATPQETLWEKLKSHL
jgi:hypothetical protein